MTAQTTVADQSPRQGEAGASGSGGRTSRARIMVLLSVVAAAVIAAVIAFSITPSQPTSTPYHPQKGPILPGEKGGNWQKVFSEGFSGTSLNTALWSTCYAWDCTNRANPEQEWFQASQDTIANGILSLTAIPQASHGYPYTSGMISSYGSFNFTYGYLQFVAKFPKGRGLWSAAWTLPQAGNWPPEIDVAEKYTNDDFVGFVIHYGANNQRLLTSARVPTFSTRFHTYAIDWEPGSVDWYVDGVERAHFAVSISDPMYLLATLNIALYDPPNSTVHFPKSLQIKSIEIWQHPGVGSSQSSF